MRWPTAATTRRFAGTTRRFGVSASTAAFTGACVRTAIIIRNVAFHGFRSAILRAIGRGIAGRFFIERRSMGRIGIGP